VYQLYHHMTQCHTMTGVIDRPCVLAPPSVILTSTILCCNSCHLHRAGPVVIRLHTSAIDATDESDAGSGSPPKLVTVSTAAALADLIKNLGAYGLVPKSNTSHVVLTMDGLEHNEEYWPDFGKELKSESKQKICVLSHACTALISCICDVHNHSALESAVIPVDFLCERSCLFNVI
jgi:hypothetical protein